MVVAANKDVVEAASQCGGLVPSADRGAHPVLQVRMFVSIKGGQMTVDDVDTSLRDVTGDSLDAVKQCVHDRTAPLATTHRVSPTSSTTR